MGFAPQPGQVAAQPVVHAFDGVRVRMRFAFEVPLVVEDEAVAREVVSGVSDCSAARNLRTQRPGRWGVAIAQRPAEYSLGSAISSPPEPNSSFFSPT